MFLNTVALEEIVTMDYSAAGDSSWALVPKTGKVMRLTEEELRFAVGTELQSAVMFTLYGEIGKDPRLVYHSWAKRSLSASFFAASAAFRGLSIAFSTPSKPSKMAFQEA